MAVKTDDIDEVDEEVARAVGLFALSDATLPETAKHVGITSWELEQALGNAGLAEVFDIDPDTDVTDEIDRLLDEGP